MPPEAADPAGRTLGRGAADRRGDRGPAERGGSAAAAATAATAATAAATLTPDEIRQRRVAALDVGTTSSGRRSSTTNSTTPAATLTEHGATTTTTPPPPPPKRTTFVDQPRGPTHESHFFTYSDDDDYDHHHVHDTTTTTTNTNTNTNTNNNNTNDEDDDDDAELQAALALSLQELSPQSAPATTTTTAAPTTTTTDPMVRPTLAASSSLGWSQVSTTTTDWYPTGEPFDPVPFHSIMWDASLTTEQDQRRWLGQGIHVRRQQSVSSSSSAAAIATTTMHMDEDDNNHDPNRRNDRPNPSAEDDGGGLHSHAQMLQELAQSPLSWGLQQQFGGPCGVLAAIQAEVLRLLLFGGHSHGNSDGNGDGGNGDGGSGGGGPDDTTTTTTSIATTTTTTMGESSSGSSSHPSSTSEANHSPMHWKTTTTTTNTRSERAAYLELPALGPPFSLPLDAGPITEGGGLTPAWFHQALAHALGILLARAALTPSVVAVSAAAARHNSTATAANSSNATATAAAATISSVPPPLPSPQHPSHGASLPSSSTLPTSSSSPSHSVRIVLPSRPLCHTTEPLAWSDWEPWDTATAAATATRSHPHHHHPGSGSHHQSTSAATEDTIKRSHHLTVYTISIPEASVNMGGSKRQKTNASPLEQQHVEPLGQPVPPYAHSAWQQEDSNEAPDSCLALEDRIHRLARVVSDFLISPPPAATASATVAPAPLEYFKRHGGVLLFVASLVASRGKNVIQEEFDDPHGSRLTSQFGHCAQELINLLLTGQAVSNVFDHTLKPSGDMECRGIQTRPAIGYLTQLESLRLCEVGSFYKSPRFPIWVVGSTSHFTVLFGSSNALNESKSDMLLEKCRRAFKAVEGGEENGFIASGKLGSVLDTLGLDIGGESAVQTLSASMEVTGAGIILWDDFWKTTSRLMTGASMESVLASDSPPELSSDDPVAIMGPHRPASSSSSSPPPLLLTYEPQNNTTSAAAGLSTVAAGARMAMSSNSGSPIETDEEMARRLTAEYNGYDNSSSHAGMSALTAAARVSSPMEVDSAALMSDEELARKLQAEWDAEVAATNSSDVAGSTGSDHAVNGSPDHIFTDFDESKVLPPTPPSNAVHVEQEDSKPAAIDLTREPPRRQEFEQYGDSFELYHYNGLRGGVLTPFRVTRLTAEEAVGASIALNHGSTGAGQGDGKSGDLEDVLRTKWPSCMINWLGQSPPYIN